MCCVLSNFCTSSFLISNVSTATSWYYCCERESETVSDHLTTTGLEGTVTVVWLSFIYDQCLEQERNSRIIRMWSDQP